jgi:hypothetical protein
MANDKITEKTAKPVDSKTGDDKKQTDPSKAKDAKLKPVEDEDLVSSALTNTNH